MIITHLQGGLGNQLFQYAAGFCLAQSLHSVIKADASWFGQQQERQPDILKWIPDISLASEQEISALLPSSRLHRAMEKLKPARFKSYYRQPGFAFDPAFFNLKSPVYIKGYFQSEKFFAPAGSLLMNKIVVPGSVQEELEPAVQNLNSINSVAIHIRKGDYSGSGYHGVLTADYYQRALAYLKNNLEDPRFFLFSDDPVWAKELLQGEKVQPGNAAGKISAFQDFYLMSRCNHQVIANSSFSWWAAWLNPNPQKIVIAPRNWFQKGPADTGDLIPSSWLTL